MTTMDLAPSVSTRRVYGRAILPDGTPAVGDVEFMSALTHMVEADNVTLVDGAATTPIDPDTGDWSIVVPCTDDPDVEPAIAAYAVRIPGARSLRSILVPDEPDDLRYVDAIESIMVPAELIGIALTGLTIGTVETGPPGGAAAASITGNAPEPELNLVIPEGVQGDRPVIEVGDVVTLPAGSSVQITWTGIGSVPNPYILNVAIPRGDQPVIDLAPVATGTPGTDASATWSGTGADDDPYVLTLTVPRGDVPIVDAIAYTRAAGTNAEVEVSGSGTPEDPYWLSIGIPRGDKGDPGGIDLANSTGVLPVARGGTGSTNSSSARLALGVGIDTAAAVASMRSLGTGADQAAAGDHGHWTEPVTLTLASNFTVRNNYSAPTASTDGRTVAITGVIDSASNTLTPMFTLPPECRPAETRYIPTVANDAFRVIQVNSDGSVSIRTPGSSSGWVNISCTFPK